MKRIEALQPLSHQHHNTLTGCLLIKKGIQKKADKKLLKDFALRLWNEDVSKHIQAEEHFLLPHLEKLDQHSKNMLQRDHDTLRVLAERIALHEDGYALYNSFANFLEHHIRFEERVVFNKMQERLSEREKDQLQNSLKTLPGKKCTDYPVKFWE